MKRIALALVLFAPTVFAAPPVSPKAPSRPGTADDGVPPIPPGGGARAGGSDDSIRPKGPGAGRTGTDDDSLRKVNPLALRQAAFIKDGDLVKALNARLSPRTQPAAQKAGLDAKAFGAQLESCIVQKNDLLRAKCRNALVGAYRGQLRNALKASGVELLSEAKGLRKDLGWSFLPPAPNAPEEPPPEDLGLTLITEQRGELTNPPPPPPQPNSTSDTLAAPDLLDTEGDDVIFARGNSSMFCGVVMFGACYKRVATGGMMKLPQGMTRGTIETSVSVAASAFAAAAIGYASAATAVTMVVSRLDRDGGRSEVCRVERRLASSVAPVFAIAEASLPRVSLPLSCSFSQQGSQSNRYQIRVAAEVWSGAGGGLGAGASSGLEFAPGSITLRGAR
jgi:hypothetical protein